MKKKILFFLLFLLFITNSYSNSFNILASVNNKLITNYDLFVEIKLLEYLNKRPLNQNEKEIILNEMINNKIKMLELEKYKITLNELEIERRINSLIDGDDLMNLKQRLKEKISTDSKWNNLIYLKFRNKLEINMQEINEKFSSSQNQAKKNEIIENEKKKKLNIISKTYFNEIKKNYLVKKL